MSDLTSTPSRPDVQVCLQCDSRQDAADCLSFEEHGAVFHFPWRMELMSELLIGIKWCGGRKMMVEGIVIGCRQSGGGCFETTVLFLHPVRVTGSDGSDCVHLPN